MAAKMAKAASEMSRFVRAVNVEADTHIENALDGYVLTATGRSVLRRLSLAIGSNDASRAWTLALPIRLYERRDYRGHSKGTILTGMSVRLEDDRSGVIEDGFPDGGVMSVDGRVCYDRFSTCHRFGGRPASSDRGRCSDIQLGCTFETRRVQHLGSPNGEPREVANDGFLQRQMSRMWCQGPKGGFLLSNLRQIRA